MDETGVELICSLDIQQRKYLLHVLHARGKWLRSRSQTLLRGSTVVGFPFQETGAECIIMSQCQGLCMLKQDGKIHQPKRDKECTRTSWLTGRLNGVGKPWYLSGGVVLGRSVENL
jgi:hypothetical protein